MRQIIKFTLPLVIVCIISAIALACTFAITNPLIEANQLRGLKQSLEDVLPDADSFEPIEAELETEGLVIEKIFKAKQSGKTIGLAAIVAAPGYQDTIKFLIGLKAEEANGLVLFKISDIKILELLETPGIGSRIGEDDFLAQFRSKNPGQDFDTITGATISSSALINAVKKASLKLIEEYNDFS